MTTILTGEPVQTHASGRTCAHPDCTTRLSTYNPEPFCAVHEPEPDWRYLGYSFVMCEACGTVANIQRDHPPRQCGTCGASRTKSEQEPPRTEPVPTVAAKERPAPETVLVQSPAWITRMEMK